MLEDSTGLVRLTSVAAVQYQLLCRSLVLRSMFALGRDPHPCGGRRALDCSRECSWRPWTERYLGRQPPKVSPLADPPPKSLSTLAYQLTSKASWISCTWEGSCRNGRRSWRRRSSCGHLYSASSVSRTGNVARMACIENADCEQWPFLARS